MISIFIPTYNSSAVISDTLDSLLNQTYKDLEILCVDDGSSDNTFDILQAYSSKDSRIKCLSKKNDGSVPYSWNFVFPHLQGSFTLYMSHDDLLANDAIEKMVEIQKKDDEIDCVIPSLVFFEKDMNHPEPHFTEMIKANDVSCHPIVDGKQAFSEMLDYSIPGFALWRTSLIRKIGMPTESFNSDEAMQRLWALNCRKVAFSDAKFGYRQSVESIVKGLKPYHFFSLATNLRLFKAMKSVDEVDEKKRAAIQYKYFESLFYLKSCFYKKKKHFSKTEKTLLNELFIESYTLLKRDINCPMTFKGIIMKIAAANETLYRLLTYVAPF